MTTFPPCQDAESGFFNRFDLYEMLSRNSVRGVALASEMAHGMRCCEPFYALALKWRDKPGRKAGAA
jgi:hypothetical protein